MIVCPKCGKEIDCLDYEASVRESGFVCAGGETYLDYQKGRDCHDFEMQDVRYSCPECTEFLTRDEDEALEFLKGERTEFSPYPEGVEV